MIYKPRMNVWSEPLNKKNTDNNWALQAKITALNIQGRVNCTSLKEQNYCGTLHVNNLQKLYHNGSRILQADSTSNYILQESNVCEWCAHKCSATKCNVSIKFNEMVIINLRQYVSKTIIWHFNCLAQSHEEDCIFSLYS